MGFIVKKIEDKQVKDSDKGDFHKYSYKFQGRLKAINKELVYVDLIIKSEYDLDFCEVDVFDFVKVEKQSKIGDGLK